MIQRATRRLFIFRFGTVCLLGMLTACAQADIIGEISNDDQLGAESLERDSAQKEVLLLARQSFQRNELATCRRLMEKTYKEYPDMLHPEVMIAQWMMAAGRQVEGQAILEKIAEEDPNRSDLRWVFAKVALRQGRLFDAWSHINASQKAELPIEWSAEWSGIFRRQVLRTKAMTATRRSKPSIAISLYKDLIRQQEQPADMLRLAMVESKQGNSGIAEKLVRRACDSPDIESGPELMMAKIYERLNQSEECESWFRKSVELDGAAGNRARLHYAQWLIRKNRADDAKGVIDDVDPAEEVPSDPDFLRGLAERMLGNMEAAGRLFVSLREKNPGNAAVNNQLALVLIETTEKENHIVARKLAAANAKFAPQSSEFAATLGWIQFRIGDLEKAENSLTAAVRQGNSSLDTLYYLSQLRAAQGNEAQAERLKKNCRDSPGEFFNKRHFEP